MKPTALGTLIVLFVPILAYAQNMNSVSETVDGKTRYVYLEQMAVTPCKPPEPALKYRLTYGYDQQTGNNAALQYSLAMYELSQSNYHKLTGLSYDAEQELVKILTDPEFFAQKKEEHEEFEKKLAATPEDAPKPPHTLKLEKTTEYQVYEYKLYCSVPREEFPIQKAREFVNRFQHLYRYIEKGSQCDHCDWEHHIRGNRNLLAVLLPEIQGCRDLIYALQVKARVEIYDKNYDGAIRTIRVGKTLARHVSEGSPILVCALVGVVLDASMNSCLLELSQQSDAPNLYWTLTDLPSPVFSFQNSFRFETDGIRIMFPEVAKALDAPDELSDDDWKEFHKSLEKPLHELMVVEHNPSRNFEAKMLINFWSTAAYPQAKQWLLSEGKTLEEIEKMSVPKVLGLWSVHRYSIMYDNFLKTANLPYWQWKEYDAEHSIEKDLQDVVTPLDGILSYLTPAFSGARSSLQRSDAVIDMMRIVEAIRYHAAENNGKLPETLDDIKVVPIPSIDPFSGKPYSYKIVDGAGMIETILPYGVMRFKVNLR